MDLEIIVDDLIKKVDIACKIAVDLALVPWKVPLRVLPYLCDYFSEKISKKDLEYLKAVTDEEAQRLGLDLSKIGISFNPSRESRTCCYKTDSGDYNLIFEGEGEMTRSSIRHELYHIYKGHVEEVTPPGFRKGFRYLFIEEPQAVGYEVKCLLEDKFPRLRKN